MDQSQNMAHNLLMQYAEQCLLHDEYYQGDTRTRELINSQTNRQFQQTAMQYYRLAKSAGLTYSRPIALPTAEPGK